MKIEVIRDTFTENETIGKMFVNDKFLCDTLEDTVREPGIKIPGKTAIPAGKFNLILDFSNRFQKIMPHILDVPNFEGIRIHSGNTAADTKGCLLVGNRQANIVVSSRMTFAALMELLNAEKQFPIPIEIS